MSKREASVEEELFVALRNHEEQYSLWPNWKPIPQGWQQVEGVEGSKEKVLEYIKQTWTDMRPLSLRQWEQNQTNE